MKKKLLSWLLILCLVVTLLPLTEQNASAATYTQSQITSKLNSMINGTSYGGKYKTGKTYGYQDCFEFARVVFNNIFGHTLNQLNYHGKYYYGNSNGTIKLVGRCYRSHTNYHCSCGGVDIATSSAKKKTTVLNSSNVKALIKKMQAGDLIQGVGTNGDCGYGSGRHQHTAIVYSVNKSKYTVRLYDANGNADNKIKLRTLSVSDLMNTNFGHCVSVYRSNKAVTAVSSSITLKAANSASSGKTVLSWSSYSGASKYYVYRKKGKSGIYSRIASTSSRSMTDTSAVNGGVYYYYVKAVSKSGKALKTSSAVCRTCDLARPTITGISNVASSGAITLSIKGVANANKYKIYRATSKNGTYSCIYNISRSKADKGGETVSFINAGATPGKTYYYKVRAVTTTNSSADSAASGYAYRTRDLARPVVSARTQSDGKIVLSWGKVSYADKYDIYRAVKGGTYSKLTTVTGTSYTDTRSLKDGTTYYYRVKAIDNSNSAATSANSITVIQKYENKVIGLVSEATYKAKYANSSLYSATPYYRYRTRSMQTTTSTSSSLSGWTLISKETGYKYGSWTTTKPSTSYESKSAYYYYTYVCDCKRLYWKSTKSDTCPNCKAKMRNLLKVYSSKNPASYYKKDTDGSYFTPKVIDKSNPGKFGTIYYMTYKGSSISKFTSTSKKNTSFLWPSSSLKQTVYRTKTPTTVYKYQKWGDWSSWSGWTSKYKENTNVEQRDTTVQYYILKK